MDKRMKKFMKGCAWTALILIAVGFVLAFAAGSVVGAVTIRDVVNAVTGGRVQVDFEDSMIFNDAFELFSGDAKMAFAASQIRELDVEVGGCKFMIQESEDAEFHVEASGTRKFQGYVSDNTLFIKGTVKATVGSNFEGKVVLKVPADFTFEKVDVEIGAGVMQLGELKTPKLDMEVGAGQITADYLEVDKLNVTVGMGEAVIDDMQVNKLEAEVGMGNFHGEGTISEKAAVECAMGNIELELTGEQTDYDYSIECGMGNVNIGGNSYSGLATKKDINNGANRKMDVECAVGNIDVQFAD